MLRSFSVFSLLAITLFLLFYSCNPSGFDYTVETVVNPYRISPLTALIKVKAEKPCRASIKVLGATPMEQSFDTNAENLEVPVVGLYPGITNEVQLTLHYEGGEVVEMMKIETKPLPISFPGIEINHVDRSKMEPGLHLCGLHLANQGQFDSWPMIFDDQGQVRWYLDLSFFGDILWPIQRIKNGHLLVGGQNVIYEYDMLGKELKKSIIDEKYRIHHDIVELPNGDLLMPVRKANTAITVDGKKMPSLNDFIILFNPATSKVTKEWDLAKSLDVGRHDMIRTTPSDWLHMNALAFDPRDSSIIVSGKNQGVAKITWNDELKWILAPNNNWGKSGRDGTGFDTQPYLLTAVDSAGKPFAKEVQKGFVSTDNFDFPWGQHSPEILPNGDIILFDNGHLRNFKDEQFYSRGVEYRIDENKKTVQQIWQFGKERGPAFFAQLISDVDYLPQTKNMLVTAGFVNNNSKIVEMTYPDNTVVFEATVNFKTLNGNKTYNWGQLDIVYRSERFEF